VKSKGPDWWVKIADFGVSKRAEEDLTALRTFTGTKDFIAPEILGLLDDNSVSSGDEYTVAIDIWSLGGIVFHALTGNLPFPRYSEPLIAKSLRAYIKGSSPFPVDVLQEHSVSKEGCDFLKRLMAPIPKDRLTAKDALSHVWVEPPKPSSGRVSAEMQRYLS